MTDDKPNFRQRHLIRKPPPRLKSFSYVGSYAYSLTICCEDRRSLLLDPQTVATVLAQLQHCADKHKFDLLAYCFMPDHLHVLVCGNDESSSLKEFVKLFKQLSGYWYRRECAHTLWQGSYYDRILRRDEHLETVARYIFENPLRKGLVRYCQDYPFMGPPGLLEQVFNQKEC